MSKYNDLQSVLIFMLESPLHRTWNLQQICRCVVLPILLDQYKVMFENKRVVMFGTWAFPEQKHINEYLKTYDFPEEGYTGKGKDVWMIDFIAKKDYTLKGVRYFKYYFKEQGYEIAFWLRQRNKKIGFVKSARR